MHNRLEGKAVDIDEDERRLCFDVIRQLTRHGRVEVLESTGDTAPKRAPDP